MKAMRSLIIIFTLILVNFVSAREQKLQVGELANGLKYYVLDDPSVKGYVNFYLVQNVGAMLEDNDENGMAHYLEHMAFNGTEHFPQGIMKFLRGKGVYTFNAKTRLNETIYQINNIPTENTELVDSCLFIIKDWCNGILLREDEVAKERNIIMEEWRVRNNLHKRMQDSIAPVLYNYSKYASRNVIGEPEIINTFNAESIRRFYNKWYRPDLQAVMIVGDINSDAFKTKIDELFSAIPKIKNVQKREDTQIKDNEEPLFYNFIDEENVASSFGIYQRKRFSGKEQDEETKIKHSLYMRLFNDLFARKFARIKNDKKEFFIAVSITMGPLVRNYYGCAWDVVPYEGKATEALKQLLAVREEVCRNGFDSIDFKELQQKMLSELKEILKDDKLGSIENKVEIFRQNFLTGSPIVDLRVQMEENMFYLLEMNVEELNSWAKTWLDDSNLSFITYTNSKTEKYLTLDDFTVAFNEVKNSSLQIESKVVTKRKLIDFHIEDGNILKEEYIDSLDVEKWTLGNGATIYYKYLPKVKKRFYFVASSMGGASAVKTADIPSFSAMKELIMQSGLYKHNRNELYDLIKDKDFNITLNIEDYIESIGGNSATEDFEAFFQYLYLILQKQVFSEDEFTKYIQRKKYIKESTPNSELNKVQDSIQNLLFPISERNPKEDISFYNKMKFEDLARIYSERFGNAADFNFCLVGGLPKEKVRICIKKYIASLPGDSKKNPEKYNYIDFSSKEHEIRKEFVADIPGDLGIIEISFHNKVELSKKEQVILSLGSRILQNRLFDRIRGEKGGSYSIDVKAFYSQMPVPTENIGIRFQTQRAKADKMREIVHKELSNVLLSGINEEELEKVKLPILVSLQMEEVDEKDKSEDVGFWLALLNNYVEKNQILQEDISEEGTIESITKEDVISVMRKVMSGAKKRDFLVKSLPMENMGRIH